MNKIYKLVWRARTQGYVVASEKASSRGRPTSQVRRAAAVATGMAGLLATGQAMAVCADIVVSANTGSPVVAACNNQGISVNAGTTVDVSGGNAINSSNGSTDYTVGTVLIDGTARGNNGVLLTNGANGPVTISGTGIIESYWGGGGSGFGGPALTLGGTFADTITNNGGISGDYAGISISDAIVPLLINAGTIGSTSTGILVAYATVDEIRNQATGTINGNNDAGITVRGSGSTVGLINNMGSISSTNSGILATNSGIITQITNAAGATISGQQAIMAGAGSIGSIENSGSIDGTDAGLALFNGTITGTVTNHATGTITGNAGISLGTDDQTSSIHDIINEGLIDGTSYGIDGHEGSVITNGLNNSGTIHGGSIGIRLVDGSSISGGIVNAGTISGGTYAIYVESGSGIDRIDLTGTHAQLIGDVGAPTTDVNVKSGAAFTTTNAFNVNKFTVESGGTLTLTGAPHTSGGLGTNGITVDQGFFNNGTVLVGATTLGQVNGSYAQSAGAALTVGVNSVASHGVLAVSGNAMLASGSLLNVDVGGNASFNAGDRVPGVLTSGGTLTVNTASGLTVQDNSVLYKFTADTSRAANELDLIVQPDQSPFTSNVGTGRTPLGGVAANLDKILADGVPSGLQSAIDRLTALPADELPAAMSQLVPVMTGAGSQAGVNALRSMNKIIQSRVESNQGLSAGNPASERFMWVRAFGSSGDQTSQDVVAGFRSHTSGIVVGGDKPINDKLRAGFAFTYARTDIDSRGTGAPSSLDVNTYELVHYGSYNLDPVTDINYQLDAGYNDVKGVRRILFMGQQAQSDFNSLNLHGSVGIGRTWLVAPQSSMTPSVRVDYTHMRTGSYTETGADALNLHVDGSTFKEFMLTADIKGSHSLAEHTKLVGNLSAGYDFLNKQSVTTSAFVGGGSVFETKGLDTSPWVYRGGLGLLHDSNDMEYNLRYDLERRTSGYTNQTLSARVRWAF